MNKPYCFMINPYCQTGNNVLFPNTMPPYGKWSFTPMTFPPQCQRLQPGIEALMTPKPISEDPNYKGSGKLKDKVAIITGGDSGIGKAVAIAYAKEGADIAIVYLCEHEEVDALETKKRIEEIGQKCLLLQGDAGDEAFCKTIVTKTIDEFGHIDILVNNAATTLYQTKFEDFTFQQLESIFHNNVFSHIYLSKIVLPYLKKGSSIICTASTAAYVGGGKIVLYSATKGAVVGFIRALALSLADRGIRVNGVAPGNTWTPLIPSSRWPEEVSYFGSGSPLGVAQPADLAPAFVFLASEADSSQMTGQVVHVNNGVILNG